MIDNAEPELTVQGADRRGAAVGLALVGLMWLLPFLQPYHWYPLTSFYSEWLAIALGLAALVVLARRGAWSPLQVPVVALFPVALAGFLMVQYAVGGLPYAGVPLTGALYLTWAALVVLLGAYLRRTLGLAPVATALAWFLLAGGLLSAMIAFLQHFHAAAALDPIVSRTRSIYVHGNLAQRNHFANYLTLAAVSLVYLFARGRLGRLAAAVCAVPLLLALPLAGSRSVWLYLAMLLVFALWPLAGARADAVARMRVLLLAVSGGFVLAQWVVTLPWFTPEIVAEGPSDRLFDVATGMAERLQLWREGWWMFAQSPLIGIGFGQFAWQHTLYQAAFPAAALLGNFNHAHNILFQLLAETGIIGAALVGAAAGAWLLGLRGVRLTLEHWWLIGLLGVISIHSMLEMPLWYAYFLGIAAIALGLGATRFVSLKSSMLSRVALVLILAVGAVNAGGVLSSYRGFEPVFTRAPGTLQSAELTGIVMRTHRDVLLEPYAELTASFAITVDDNALEQKIDLNGRVMRFVPLDLVVHRQALLLAMRGHRQEAERLFTIAVRVYPWETENTAVTLRDLARKYPGRFERLLELATAKSGVEPDTHTTR
jgi:O-antigen ligase